MSTYRAEHNLRVARRRRRMAILRAIWLTVVAAVAVAVNAGVIYWLGTHILVIVK